MLAESLFFCTTEGIDASRPEPLRAFFFEITHLSDAVQDAIQGSLHSPEFSKKWSCVANVRTLLGCRHVKKKGENQKCVFFSKMNLSPMCFGHLEQKIIITDYKREVINAGTSD